MPQTRRRSPVSSSVAEGANDSGDNVTSLHLEAAEVAGST